MTDRARPSVDFVSLPDDEDYLMRPVKRGMCHYESLKNGAVSLYDIAKMNDALDVEDENNARWNEHLERRHGR